MKHVLLGNAQSASIKARQEPEMFDEHASIDHLVWSLENNLDDLIEGHSKTPQYVRPNSKRLLKIKNRFDLLCSNLVAE